VLPETNLCDHRQTGITAIEPWRLVLLVCVAKVACMVFKVCRQAGAHTAPVSGAGQCEIGSVTKIHTLFSVVKPA